MDLAQWQLFPDMLQQDGRLILPDDMSYRLLVLPSTDRMTPQLATKIGELAPADSIFVFRRAAINGPWSVAFPLKRVASLPAEKRIGWSLFRDQWFAPKTPLDPAGLLWPVKL